MWRPITRADQVVGAIERAVFDFKKTYDLSHSLTPNEIAKDVAAFASGGGGTIVIGAVEQGGRVVHLEGVSDVPALIAAFRQAVSQNCFPPPSYTEARLDVDAATATRIVDGSTFAGALLAINVGPDPRGPIGVAVPNPTNGAKIVNAYKFPVRIGDGTSWLSPQELVMWMNSPERRAAVAISRIPGIGSTPVAVTLHHRNGEMFQGHYTGAYELVSLDENERVIVVQRPPAQFDSNDFPPVRVPLTYVHAVWQDGAAWHLAIAGRLYHQSGSERERFFAPLITGAGG